METKFTNQSEFVANAKAKSSNSYYVLPIGATLEHAKVKGQKIAGYVMRPDTCAYFTEEGNEIGILREENARPKVRKNDNEWVVVS